MKLFVIVTKKNTMEFHVEYAEITMHELTRIKISILSLRETRIALE